MDYLTGQAPIYFMHENAAVSKNHPSSLHASDTGLAQYFRRYLLQKAMSVFEWKLPEHWSKDYFLYILYCYGYISVINTKQFGVIPQGCSLRGYDVFYRPTNVLIANPLFTGLKDLKIGQQCTLFKLQPDYGSIMDIVEYYADMLALCSQTIGTNLFNSRLAYVFTAKNKGAAESFKKMFDKIASGDPAVFADAKLFNEDGSPAWETFTQNLKENYIVSDILCDMQKINNMFDTEIGIPNANTDKRERLITDEVNANNFETKSKCALWLEELQKAAKQTNDMFGINVSVDWREDLKNANMGGVSNAEG